MIKSIKLKSVVTILIISVPIKELLRIINKSLGTTKIESLFNPYKLQYVQGQATCHLILQRKNICLLEMLVSKVTVSHNHKVVYNCRKCQQVKRMLKQISEYIKDTKKKY